MKIIIVLIIIVIILTPVIFTFYTNYKQEQERIGFRNALVSASNIENQSDIELHEVADGVSSYTEEIGTYLQEDQKNYDEEISILKEFNKTTSNQTQSEYLDLEIRRLEAEKLTYNQVIMDKTLNNEIITNYNQIVVNIKLEVMNFLIGHPDLKQDLESWGIDEDFIVEQKDRYN